ncbi:MAG TPA: penicillin acylase family protein [Verrucomicrobiota bacterium]|nr:penicillin acylase family protein [Verrucomicrobiota bacterium]HNU52507.1 penicillin acylase family protein [Verrucomicrobiota bacterium]
MNSDVTPSPPYTAGRRIRRWLLRLLVLLGLLLVLAVVGVWLALRGSLARLDGETRLPGLTAAVVVERDAEGVPTVTAGNRADLFRAVGYVHAQERFFQMDLLRRASAAELSELFGPAALEYDRHVRPLRLRSIAEKVVTRIDSGHQRLLQAYSDGVNAGLAALRVRPPEYLLLRVAPRAWQPADSILVLHRMGMELSDPGAGRELENAIARQALPPVALAFYVRHDTVCPAALDGSTMPIPRVPTPDEFSLRGAGGEGGGGGMSGGGGDAGGAAAAGFEGPEEYVPGSNAWAIGGQRTATGVPMLANDMHLGHSMPNIWYRMQFVWPDADGTERRTIGVTLPGTGVMVVGSNGRIAWGVTASQIDVTDLVLLETDADHPNAYRVGDTWKSVEVVREVIRVAGRPDVVLELPWSPWGPVVTNALGQRAACHWAMLEPDAANLGLAEFERASGVGEVLDAAPRCGLPWLNVVAADRDGDIGWTLGGRFPKRVGFDGCLPESRADGSRRWDGWISPGEMPRVLNPASGAIWSANQRQFGSELYLRMMGSDVLDQGARAGQIRDQLLQMSGARPADLLAVQLDDRALFLEPWQRRLLSTLDRAPHEARLAEARVCVQNWGGRAGIDSVGYRLVRRFRHEVIGLLVAPVADRCRQVSRGFGGLPGHAEGVARDLLEQRPAHLLPRPFNDYDELLLAAAKKVLEGIPTNRPLAEHTWGDANRVKVRHPLGANLPAFSRWLDLPERMLPGDQDMPRAQGRGFGASERMVVSPGREAEGLFHMPGGQSGHFLSPFYRAGHVAWEEGRPTPLLPGPTRYSLRLKP